MFEIVFMMTDQPTTCPYCGRRTEIVSDLLHTKMKAQVHKCPGESCNSVFVEVEDEEFIREKNEY
jgi:hypothetical protein